LLKSGQIYLQDPATRLPIELLAPQPGEKVLDLCAAPGGKTSVIAEQMQNQGRLIAHDPDPARLGRVVENAARLGLSCVTTARTPGEIDAAGPYDAILVDAPCSNTGVFRRRVEARWRLTESELTRLADTQRRLLADAARRLKPGGRIVYSTCSLEAADNEDIVAAFLAAHPDFACDSRRLLTPIADGVDGAFAARLRRRP